MSEPNLTKHSASILFVVYVLLLPVWLYVADWYHIVIGYFCYWFIADVVQSLFMHRWASHKSWNPPNIVQKVLSTIGVVALVGTPISWAAWHRTHHHYVDTDKDPHSPKYFSWLYILFARYHTAQTKRAIDHLRNPYFVWLSKHELYLILLGNLLLFTILPFIWFMTLWAIPVGYTIFNTNFFVNIVCHKKGKAENISWLYWFILFSDGIYHDYHHKNPILNHTKFDPAGFLITKLGWTNA